MSRAAERRAKAEAFGLAREADWLGQPYQKQTTCFDCDAFVYCRGRRWNELRCFPCHVDYAPARRRARRRARV